MKLQWKQVGESTTQAGFGDPVSGTTAIAFCIYDDANALVEEIIVDRGGGDCAGRSCWRFKGTTGYSYKDKGRSANGISKIGYTAGDPGKGKADVNGKNNASKAQSSLPTGVAAKLTGNLAPTIQLVTSGGFCATATMNTVKKDDSTRYSAQLK